jgi:hypothetical protein
MEKIYQHTLKAPKCANGVKNLNIFVIECGKLIVPHAGLKHEAKVS